jgi:two-component system, response regulator RpfG
MNGERLMDVAIVDDNETNVRVYAQIVVGIPGTATHCFTSSTAALAWCASTEPDLVILDYRMPPPDGIEFIERYHALRPASETPIVMVTGERDRAVRRRALELGASDFLNKPADAVELLARVRNLLSLRQSRVALSERAETLAAEVARATREIADREEETIHRLMRAAEFRDNETGMHIVRMGHYAAAIGAHLGMNDADRRILLLATPMHDIGKVATPDRILLKPGPLTPDEWEIMRAHTTSGYDVLSGSTSRVLVTAAEIALRHHERWDGSGYPGGLRGEQISLPARIAAVCDVFDALVSERPYKRAWGRDEAFAEIARCAGTHFDPGIAAAFLESRQNIVRVMQRFADGSAAA